MGEAWLLDLEAKTSPEPQPLLRDPPRRTAIALAFAFAFDRATDHSPRGFRAPLVAQEALRPRSSRQVARDTSNAQNLDVLVVRLGRTRVTAHADALQKQLKG